MPVIFYEQMPNSFYKQCLTYLSIGPFNKYKYEAVLKIFSSFSDFYIEDYFF